MGPARILLRFLALASYLSGVATGVYALVLASSILQSSGSGTLELLVAVVVTVLLLLIGRALSQQGKGTLGHSGGLRERLGR